MDRRLMGIVFQGLPEEYRDVKRMIWKDPDLDRPKIQSVLHHLYLEGLPRSKTSRIAGRDLGMAATTALRLIPAPIICHEYGKAGRHWGG